MCTVDSDSVKPRQSHKTVWCTCFSYKYDVYKHIQAQVWKWFFMSINYLFISYVLSVDIFTRSFDDFISMKFLIAVFFPASPFVPISLFIIFGDFCQPPCLLHPIPVYYFGRNLPNSPFIPPSYSIWNSRVR